MSFIAFGSNPPSFAGPPRATALAALAALEEGGVRVARLSRLYDSPAWPDPAEPRFVNGVAEVETTLTPGELMARLHEVEARFGRVRGRRNAPRTLDLDLIDYDGRISEADAAPILPHPRAHERAFVLAPLLDLAPGWLPPVSGASGAALLNAAAAAGSLAFALEDGG